MILNEFPALWAGIAWLLTNRTCTMVKRNAVGNSFGLAEVARPHLLVVLQHGIDVVAIVVVFDI